MADDNAGPISQDEGLALLADIPHAEREEDAAPAQETASEQSAESPAEASNDAPEQPAGEQEAPEESEQSETPAVEAPQNWDAAARARFQTLDPETQAFLREQYDNGERAVGQKMEEVSAARKAAETEANGIRELRERLDSIVPQAEQAMQSKWDRVDWVAWSQQDPEACMQGRMQYEAEQRQLQQLQAARQEAESKSYKAFVDEQLPQMAKLIPGLSDPKSAQPYMDKMVAYARSEGATDTQLKYASAKEWALIDKARLWDESQSKLAKTAPPKPVAAAPARPAAAIPPQAPQQRRVSDLSARLSKTGSMADAAALLEASGL